MKAILGAVLVVGGLAVGATTAFAVSSSQSTTLSFTVPTSISLTGIPATVSATTPAGTTTQVFTGTDTISTNDTLGYKLTIVAAAANFVGTASATNTISAGADTVAFCAVASPPGSCAAQGTLSTVALTLHTTSVATAGDTFTTSHSIIVPATQAADTYTLSVTYTATGN